MFEITNTPRQYVWGSTTALAELRGVEPSGHPEAELWFGDHPAGPSVRVEDGLSLLEWRELDDSRRPLPFLVKILAVATPLSVQVHPTREHAAAGFDRENAAGIPIDAPDRCFVDRNHKPEMVRAVSAFSALCGFRPEHERTDILRHLVSVDTPGAEDIMTACTAGVRYGVDRILEGDDGVRGLARALAVPTPASGVEHVDDALGVARRVAESFPGDPGVVLTLFLNHIELAPGEVFAVPAGTVHAYLSGLCVEVMASSDNVLRGGLTAKHIDVYAFLAAANFGEALPIRPETLVAGPVRRVQSPFDEFSLTEVDVAEHIVVDVSTPAIALVVAGTVTVGADTTASLTAGRAVLLESGDSELRLEGRGTVVIAYRPV